MLFGLIALAIMLIGAAAMVRSMNTSLFKAQRMKRPWWVMMVEST